MKVPRLHVVTDDAVLARPDFRARAAELLGAGGPAIAFQLRGPHLSALALHGLAAGLAAAALRAGARLLINERVDIALAVRAGAHLNARSIPLPEARRLLHNAPLGYSAHGLEGATLAAAEGADYIFLGNIYPTSSHPDRPAAGPDLVGLVAPAVSIPVIAIGGITPDRAAEAASRGAFGVAVISGIWSAPDPVATLRLYLDRLANTAFTQHADSA